MALDPDLIDHWFLFPISVEFGASQRLQHSRQAVVVSYPLRGIRRIIRVRLEGGISKAGRYPLARLFWLMCQRC